MIDLLCSVSDSKPLVVDVHIGEAVQLHVVLFGSIASEQRMRVRVDQPRKGDEARTILLVLEGNAFFLDPLRNFLRRGDLGDDAFAVNRNGDVGLGLDGASLLEGEVIGRRSYGDELPDVGEQKPM